jgi:hypothetical protein
VPVTPPNRVGIPVDIGRQEVADDPFAPPPAPPLADDAFAAPPTPPMPSLAEVPEPARPIAAAGSMPTLAPIESGPGELPPPRRPSYLVEPTPKPPPIRPVTTVEPPAPPPRSTLGIPVGLLVLAGVGAAAVTGIGILFLMPAPKPPPAPVEAPPSEYVAVPLGTHAQEDAIEEAAPEPAPPPRPRKPVATGLLRVTSTPVAAVRLDGKYAGDTSAFEQKVPVGWHTVTIKAPGRTEAELRINVLADQPAAICWDFDKARYCE